MQFPPCQCPKQSDRDDALRADRCMQQNLLWSWPLRVCYAPPPAMGAYWLANSQLLK